MHRLRRQQVFFSISCHWRSACHTRPVNAELSSTRDCSGCGNWPASLPVLQPPRLILGSFQLPASPGLSHNTTRQPLPNPPAYSPYCYPSPAATGSRLTDKTERCIALAAHVHITRSLVNGQNHAPPPERWQAKSGAMRAVTFQTLFTSCKVIAQHIRCNH